MAETELLPDIFYRAQWLQTVMEATPPRNRTDTQKATIEVCQHLIAALRVPVAEGSAGKDEECLSGRVPPSDEQ